MFAMKAENPRKHPRPVASPFNVAFNDSFVDFVEAREVLLSSLGSHSSDITFAH